MPPRTLVLLASIMCTGAIADPLDNAMLQEMKREHIPGVSVVVVQNGRIVKEKGYGLANVEHGVPVTPETKFQSGSIGKMFTAALVMLLVEDGKLKLDDPISRHLANTPEAWDGITIRHLLTHTSGLGDPYEVLDFRKDYSDEELVALEAGIPVLFAPAERWAYSNMGYHLLGFICNKAGGAFYGDQLRERIFKPLGMGTRIISESDIVPHRAAGYEWVKGQLKNQSWVAPKLNTTADGSLYLTAHDLALWDMALDRKTILTEQIRTASWTPVTLNDGSTAPYGYGWDLSPVNGHRTISHGGSWQGFKTAIERYVDDKLTVIVLANSAAARPAKLANLVARHYVPALEIPLAKAIPDSEPDVAAKLRAVVSQMAKGSVPSGVLSDKAAAVFSPQRVQSLSQQMADLGTLRAVELLERKADGDQRVYRYRFIYPDERLLIGVTFDKAGSIDKLSLRPE
ncbi:serine hydrolase domain-containing protein [Massilia phyllosphaerae]|uniref:serine hydrolase domain-containing protein n=1 Tax=Massilia phyllosphaerae TaxID=3106034 RepID=UPI002B1CAADE|nr:serine hydrolase domain-containing protein [Massilia sp. SGZ-792]